MPARDEYLVFQLESALEKIRDSALQEACDPRHKLPRPPTFLGPDGKPCDAVVFPDHPLLCKQIAAYVAGLNSDDRITEWTSRLRKMDRSLVDNYEKLNRSLDNLDTHLQKKRILYLQSSSCVPLSDVPQTGDFDFGSIISDRYRCYLCKRETFDKVDLIQQEIYHDVDAVFLYLDIDQPRPTTRLSNFVKATVRRMGEMATEPETESKVGGKVVIVCSTVQARSSFERNFSALVDPRFSSHVCVLVTERARPDDAVACLKEFLAPFIHEAA